MNEDLRSMRHSIDPALWATETFGIVLDPWQVEALRSRDKRILFNCSRQSGKSTIAALKAVHRVIFHPGSLVLLISPSLRQSSELFRKVMQIIDKMPHRPALVEENKLSLTTADGSRIVSLPSNEEKIRGFSNVSIIIEDEAAAVPDDLYHACLPMLATSNGQYVQLSTPRGKRGHFFDSWESPEWKKIRITAAEIRRISNAFLDSARKDLGSRMFQQEFMCEFLEDLEGSMFRREWFEIVDVAPADLSKVRRWDLAAGGRFKIKDLRPTLTSITVNGDMSLLPAMSAQLRHSNLATTQRSYYAMQQGVAGKKLRESCRAAGLITAQKGVIEHEIDTSG